MYKLLFQLIQAVWPYLKESWLQGQDLKDWVKHNKMSVVWLTIVLTMTIAILTLTAELTDYRAAYAKQGESLKYSQTHVVSLVERNRLLEADAVKYMTINSDYDALKKDHEELVAWSNACLALQAEYHNKPCPARTVTKTVVHTVPVLAKTPHPLRGTRQTTRVSTDPSKQETFRDKVKRILGKDQ